MRVAEVSERTYYRIKDDLKRKRTWLRKRGSGAISKLKNVDKVKINDIVRKNPFSSLKDMRKTLRLEISCMTIGRYLKEAGYIRRKPHSKLDHTPTHIENRYWWANNMRTFRWWGEVVFADETSIWLNDNGHDGWFHNDHDHPLSMDKHSGKIHVWAAITIFGKLSVLTFRENLNSSGYSQILRQYLIPAANLIHPYGWVLLHDGSPCHKGDAIEVLYYELPYVLKWPSKSPDVNPIENVWHMLKSQVRKRLPKTVDDLEKVIIEEWENLDNEKISNIACSFQFRVKTLFNRKGHMLNY
jgi:hypothetical protein